MGVETSVTSCASKVAILTIRNVLLRARVSVFLGQTVIDQMNDIGVLAKSHQEIVWLYVSMNIVLPMDLLNALDHLVSNHKNCLHGEFFSTEIEQISETRPKHIHDHHIKVILYCEPVHLWDTHVVHYVFVSNRVLAVGISVQVP